MPFAAEPDKPFDAERHQVAGSKEMPPAGAVVAETVGSGYTFQGGFCALRLCVCATGMRRRKRSPKTRFRRATRAGKSRDGFSLESPE